MSVTIMSNSMFKVSYQAIEIGEKKHQGNLMFPADMLGHHKVGDYHLLSKDRLFKTLRTYLFKSGVGTNSICALTDIKMVITADGLSGTYEGKELNREPNEDDSILLNSTAPEPVKVEAQAENSEDKPKMSPHKARLVALKTELQDLQIKGQDTRLSKAEVKRISQIKKELKVMRDEQEEFENQVADGTAKEAEGRGSRYMDKVKRMGREFEDKAFAAFSASRR